MLYRLSGGQPYFVKLLLTTLIERQKLGKPNLLVDQVMLERALEDAVEDHRARVDVFCREETFA